MRLPLCETGGKAPHEGHCTVGERVPGIKPAALQKYEQKRFRRQHGGSQRARGTTPNRPQETGPAPWGPPYRRWTRSWLLAGGLSKTRTGTLPPTVRWPTWGLQQSTGDRPSPLGATVPSVEAFLASSRRLVKNTNRNASTDGTVAPRGPEEGPPTGHKRPSRF